MPKLTEDELKRVQLLKEETLEVVATLGELEYRRLLNELLIEKQKEKIKELNKIETGILEELEAKYGIIQLNLETGEYS